MFAVMGLFVLKSMHRQGRMILGIPMVQLAGMILGGLVMVVGYFFAEGIMYGNFITAMAGVPWNVLQFTVGTAFATLLAAALYKTPARKYFEYQVPIGIETKK